MNTAYDSLARPFFSRTNNEKTAKTTLQTTKTRRSLQFFTGKDYDISDEFNEVQQKYEAKNKSNKESWKFIVKRMFSKAFLRPFSCVGILYIINAWVGFIQIQVFVIEILEKSGSSIDPKMAPIIIGFVRLTFAGNFEPKIQVFRLFKTMQVR